MIFLQKIREQFEKRKLVDILRIIWKSSRRWMMAAVVLVIIDSIFPVLVLFITKLVLDTVTVALETGADLSVMFDQVLIYIVLLAVVSILSVIFRAGIDYAYSGLSLHVTDYLYTMVHSKATELDLASYEIPEYYDILHRAEQEVSYRPTEVVRGLLRTAKNGLSLIGIVGLLATFNPAVTLILVGAVLPSVAARFWYSRRLYSWRRQNSKTERQIRYLNDVMTGQEHAKENRLFGLGNYFANRSLHLRDNLREEEMKLMTQFYVSDLLAQVISTAIIIALFAVVVQRTLAGSITIGDLVMYYQAFERGQSFLRGFLGGLVEIYENSLFISNLYEFLELEAKITDPNAPQIFPVPIQQGIVLENVSFRYPDSTRHALKNINMTIGPEETIAIVGENGSGKTTLVKLLCRLYDPFEGRISIDGISLSDFSVNDLRGQISVVFQDYVHYHLTARENIWLGQINLPLESEQVISAAAYSGANAVISKLDQGYDTILGKRLDEGEELSIGEWQKIALSRAYLRNSQILILDEPTSALDANAEQEVFSKLREMAKGKSTILISHRLSTIKMADRIYYLNDGMIVEAGTHNELIRQQGMYASMFEAQAKNYR